MNAIKLGVVGYGFREGKDTSGRGGTLFRQSVENLDGILPTAVCDITPAAREHAARKFPGIAVFEDYGEMLTHSGIDALIVSTPATCHAEFSARALRAGIHVLSEIPTVFAIEEANDLWQAHVNSRAIYMTGSNTNFRGYIDAAVDLKARGILGKPIYAESEYVHDLRSLFEDTPWRRTYEPIRYCTHSLGPLLRLIDEDLEWVSCFDTGSHLRGAVDEHDFMSALFRTRSNVTVRFLASFINEAGFHFWNYRVFTDKGIFERTMPQWTSTGLVPAEGPRTLFYSRELPLSKNRVELPVGDMPPEFEDNARAKGHGGIDYAMMTSFFKAIREGGPSPVSLRDGLRMTLPGLYAVESARNGGALTRIRYPWNTE